MKRQNLYPNILLGASSLDSFGMLMRERTYSSSNYIYGFQGQNKDAEIYGEGNSENYKYRICDTRIGRFLSVDPLYGEFPWNSQYAFSENRVFDRIELEGLETESTQQTNYNALISVVNAYDAAMTQYYNMAIGGTRNRAPKFTKGGVKGLMETGFQIVGKDFRSSRITKSGMKIEDGTMSVDKPTDLKEGEKVLVDFHSHPQTTGDEAYAPNSDSPPSAEDIFNVGYYSGANISIIENGESRWAITVDNREELNQFYKDGGFDRLQASIKSQMQNDAKNYKAAHNGSLEGFDGNASQIKAIKTFFKDKKNPGISIYESKPKNKKEFIKVI